jgi:DNA polymerase-3 subunit epsilon
MVTDAPKFFEVARDIVNMTENRTIVAHNSNFDYSFIRHEFKSLGYNFQREQLCTVKLSRKLIPGLRSYSLGTLCSELGIEITGRHRAAGDAMATARLFEILIDLNHSTGLDISEYQGLSKKGLHPDLSLDTIKSLPEEPGLYYFYNENKELIYIGKSRNIKSRVISHLNNNSSKRAIEMKQQIAGISYEMTGSELIALLKESDEIKNNKTLYNRTKRRGAKLIRSFMFENENMIIVDTGRNFDEYSVIKIERGKYIGYGYIDRDIPITGPAVIDDYISNFDDNSEVQSIISNHLNAGRVVKVIHY